MKFLLLLGAGFSHNWNGWLSSEAFEYLLGAPAIVQSQRLRNLLWAAKARGDGFEGALSDLQSEFDQDQSDDNRIALVTLERAVNQMFADMNRGFLQRVNFEFSNQVENSVGRFLARFDAIFTLNQDLLLERHYLSNDGYFTAPPRPRDGPSMPGMRAHRAVEHAGPTHWSGPTWEPVVPAMLDIPARTQPYFKLHGSSNWQTPAGGRLLVAGGNKVHAIRSLEILRLYSDEFERRLSEPGTRLMTIGYGFRDEHINDAIKRAGGLGELELYIVDPRGTDAVFPPGAGPAAVGGGRNRDGPQFEDFICGASRRPLSLTFAGDAIEHAKLMRFFEV
jgi:hypothetical protein